MGKYGQIVSGRTLQKVKRKFKHKKVYLNEEKHPIWYRYAIW